MPPPGRRHPCVAAVRPRSYLIGAAAVGCLTLLLPTPASSAATASPVNRATGSTRHHHPPAAQPAPAPTPTLRPPLTPSPAAPPTPGYTPPAGRRTLTIAVPPALNLQPIPGNLRLFQAVLTGITVTATGPKGSTVAWTATVTTASFQVRHGPTWAPVTPTSLTYTPAPATTTATGLTCQPTTIRLTPNSPTATHPAFTCAGRSPQPAARVSWNATITVQLPTDSLTGSYTTTITHSVY